MNDSVTIIVVTYNNLECIKHVTGDILTKTTYPYELVVVDNYSTEPEVRQYLNALEKQKKVQVIRLDQNIYYWPAVNVGIRKSNSDNRYTLILNDDVVIESNKWIQEMIKVIESEDNIAYVGDFISPSFSCPPFGGYIDGWCMLFKTKVFSEVGLFDEEYVWWFAPADYFIRTYKLRYRIKDIKKEGDKVDQIKGIIYHLRSQTINKLRKQKKMIPEDLFFQPDFRYEKLLLKHGLWKLYIITKFSNLTTDFHSVLKRWVKKII